MATIGVPTGYSLYSVSDNSVTLYRSDATTGQPRFMIIDRVSPVFNQAKKSWSSASWRCRVFRGVVDAEGYPIPQKAIGELSFVWPIGADAQIDTILVDLGLIFDDANLLSSVKGLMIPNT